MNITLKGITNFIIINIISVITLGAQGLSSAQIDSLVKASMKLMPQAGVAVAVVKDGQVIHNRGYGLASVVTGERVDETTLFSIASNSKAFTAAALAILVDEGKLSWDDKVVDHIPEFKMYDPYVTENFNIVDLLTHRSGLGLGAGDLMIFPDKSDFTIEDILKSFQYQQPVSAFRTKYDYDNLLYIVAGEIIARISGMTWQEFIESRIMEPLGMKYSAASYNGVKDRSRIAMPHTVKDGGLVQISPYTSDRFNGAAGITACVDDLSRWLLLQLNGGMYGDSLDQQLFSEKAQAEMWEIHTPIKFSAKGDPRYRNHFTAYGLGWQLSDTKGYTMASHTGGYPGMLSKSVIIPELNLGVVVLTNTEPGGYTYTTLPQAIVDSYLGVEPKDWNEWAFNRLQKNQDNADSVLNAAWTTVKEANTDNLDPEDFAGMYEDDWFGKIVISLEKAEGKNGIDMENRLMIRCLRSPLLKGEMFYYKANTFAIKWEYTDMECNAFATFCLDRDGKAVGFKMEGISPLVDFSFDFQDLDLKRVEE